jgi:S1-C subfamily serine protease
MVSEDYPVRIGLINAVVTHLYGAERPTVVVSEILSLMSDFDGSLIKRTVDESVRNNVIDWESKDEVVKVNANGKALYSFGCIPEVILGLKFCLWKYRTAVVQLNVPGTIQDVTAGTGFFVEDPADCVITNRHVVEKGRVISITDCRGNEICGEITEVKFHPGGHDLALVRCETPLDCTPLRIDWATDAASSLEDVLVLGYPKIALHFPTLIPGTASVCAYAPQMSRDERMSLILTRVGGPGSSGGPVINSKGFVVGVISGEPIADSGSGATDTILVAVPSFYIKDLRIS